MALTKISGSILKDPLNLGEVSIGGTLTYQDVTNVDAIGIGTFRSGINVSGGQLDVGSNIKLGNAGVVTATRIVSTIGTFTGDTAISGDLQVADIIKHAGDVNTKIRFPSNDQISFETSGSERLRITSDGYVQTKSELWVGGSVPVLRWRDATHGEKATARISGSDLFFEVANNERLRITSSGRVGINQTNPDRMLEVSNDDAPAAKFGGAGGGQDFAIEIGQLTSSSSPGLNATGGSAMLFKNNGTESMRLIASGSGGGVGIQTSNSGDAKSLNVYTPGSGDGKYAMQIENGYGSGSGGNILKMKTGRGDGTIDIDVVRLDLYNNTRIFSIDNSGLMRFRSGCGSGSQVALAVYGVRAWINFNSTSNNAIRGKGGLSGVTDRGTGQYTFNFSTSMPDSNYTATCNSGNQNSGTSNRSRMSAYSLTTSNFKIDDYDSGHGNAPTHQDRQVVHVMVVR